MGVGKRQDAVKVPDMANYTEDKRVLSVPAIDEHSLTKARAAIRDGSVWGIAVSGKLASGKDTVAQRVMEELSDTPSVQLSWATPLKDELDSILDTLSLSTSTEEAALSICETGVPLQHARVLAERLWEEARSGARARGRTPLMRWALQYLGTDVRRHMDPEYWVSRAAALAVDNLNAGHSVFYTDCRFPNEVDAAQYVGLFTIRLNVSPEVQAARLESRDGLQVDASALTHPSEVALDDFDHFDLVVDNNGPIEEVVDEIVSAVRNRVLL